ncbi:hypothetical protein KPL47_05840 [Clostridium estertheticum]|uniref:NACHT domain-containing protein n=1 Tax=Clostridium estertheticum TaxID=238834 RepID=UPI001C0ABD8A|nr:NACHT domain-containing protein [Clostridium estertheticum]MBU3175886.1 hypothetical protein [Clostridium estertheticum]
MPSSNVLTKIVLIVAKPFFDYGMGCFYLQKNKKQFIKICHDELYKISDCSSLDSDEFYVFVDSIVFQELLKSYYIMVRMNKKEKPFINNLIILCKEWAPNVNEIELRRFENSINNIVQRNHVEILSKDIKLFHIMTLICQSNNLLCEFINEKFDEVMSVINKGSNSDIYTSDYTEVILEHHRICFAEYNIIKFTGIDGAENKKEYKLKDLYVPNDFYLNLSTKFITANNVYENEILEIKQTKILYSNMLNISNRLVILGGAGYGKSTFLEYLFCYYDDIYGKKDILKVKLNLKDIVKKIDNNFDIERCIYAEMRKRVVKKYSNELIEKIVIDYLCAGKCLILFDALDEIDILSKRIEIRKEINNFCNKYILNKFIITSREVGYLRNQFDNTFLHLRISPFDDQQIREYCGRWFKFQQIKINIKIDDKYVKEQVDKFMNEVNKARCLELINNPIMLVLSLIVFKVENKLPHAKIDFYKKCIRTFLTQREESKGAFDMEQIANIYCGDLVMPTIAYYKSENEKSNQDYKFSVEDIKELTFKAIEIEGSEKTKWMYRVTKFVEYLKERTELIKEIDDGKNDFTHKSFQDYFLAIYYSRCISHDELMLFIKSSIADASNHELAVLIIQYITKESIVEHRDDIIRYILDEVENKYSSTSGRRKRRRKMQGYAMSTFSKGQHCLRILEELFLDNALPPKFHDRFISFYFECSDMLPSNIRYKDSIYLLESFKTIFLEKFMQIDLKYKIEVLLNLVWANDIVEKLICNDKELGPLYKLLSIINPSLNKYKRQKKNVGFYEFMEFTTEKYKNVIQKYELLYYDLISFCVQEYEDKQKYNVIIDILLELSIEKCQIIDYASTYELKKILLVAAESPQNYALLLKVMPKSIENLKKYIRNATRDYEMRKKHENGEELIDEINKFNYVCDKCVVGLLLQLESYDQFIYELRYYELYNDKYEGIYNYAFNCFIVYSDREKINIRRYLSKNTTNNNLIVKVVAIDTLEK